MAGGLIDVAYVEIVPDLKRFDKETIRGIKKSLQDAAKEADKGGKDIGDRLTGNVKKSFGTDFASSIGKSIGSIGEVATKSLGALAKGGGFTLLAASAAQAAVAVSNFVAVLAPAGGIVAALPGLALGAAVAIGTLKIALSGVGDALKAGLSGDAEKFNKALEGLAPNAQLAVKEIVKLKPAFDELKKSVQGNFFADFDKVIGELATGYLPVLQQQLPAIATSMGVFALNAGQAAADGANVSVVSGIMDSVALSIGRAADGIGSLVTGFIQASSVAGPLIERLGEGFANVANRFGDFLTEASASGQLQSILDTAIATLSTLGGILSNIGGIFSSVFGAAASSGGNILNTLLQLTDQMNVFLQSAQGTQALEAIFGGLAQVGAALSSTLGAVLPAIGQALTSLAPALGPLAAALGGIVTAIAPILPVVGMLAATIAGQLTGALTAITPIISAVASVFSGVLAQVLPQIAGAFLQIVTAIAPLIPPLAQLVAQIIGGLVPALAPLIALLVQVAVAIAGPLIQALGILIPPIVQIVQVIAAALMPVLTVLGQAFTQILNALLPLLPPLVQLLSAILPIIPLIAQLAATLISALLPAIIPIIELVVKLATEIIGLLVPAVTFIVQTILGPLIGAFSSLIGFLGKVIGAVVGFVTNFLGNISSIPGKVLSAIGNVGSLLFNAGQSIVQGLINGLLSMLGKIASTMSNIVGKVKDFLPFSPAKIGPLSGTGDPMISGEHIAESIATGIASQASAIDRAMSSMMSSLAPTVGMGETSLVKGSGYNGTPYQQSPVQNNQPVPVMITIDSRGSNLDELLLEIFRKSIRIRGGNVQKVLGKTAGGVA